MNFLRNWTCVSFGYFSTKGLAGRAIRWRPKGKLYLPLARAACRIVLVYEGSRIVSVEQGPAFDPDEWATIVGEVATSIVRGPIKVGREYSFALFSRDRIVARTAFSGTDPSPSSRRAACSSRNGPTSLHS